MKKIATLFFLLAAFAFSSNAQVSVISIDSARVTTNGTTPVDSGLTIQVSGTVYGPNSYPTPNGMAFWLNNHAPGSGIKVYSKHVYTGYPTLNDGDSITVVGTLTDFYGSAEIDLNSSAPLDTIIFNSSATPDAPVVILPNGLSTLTYGFLVQVNNVNMSTATKWGPPTPHKAYFTAKTAVGLYIYVDSFTNAALYNWPQPHGIYNIRGIGDDYSPTEFNIDPRDTNDFIFVSNATEIQELTALSAAIYPNPASTQLNVNLSSDKEEAITAQIFDITGRMVLNETKDLVNGDNNIQFSTANFTNGLYILELRTAEKYMNTKIVISK
jgi:type IX secretion system substrate protein